MVPANAQSNPDASSENGEDQSDGGPAETALGCGCLGCLVVVVVIIVLTIIARPRRDKQQAGPPAETAPRKVTDIPSPENTVPPPTAETPSSSSGAGGDYRQPSPKKSPTESPDKPPERDQQLAPELQPTIPETSDSLRGKDYWTGPCLRVIDGDTIVVRHGIEKEKIRLFGVDCPEKSQDFGSDATSFTKDWLNGGTCSIVPVEKDRYGRTVAWVYKNDESLNTALVRSGHAWWYEKYAADSEALERAQKHAKKANRGLWGTTASPTPPWEYRHSR